MLLYLEPSRLTDLSINNTITHKIGFNGSVIANGIGGRDIRPKVISGVDTAVFWWLVRSPKIWIRISRRVVIPSITGPNGEELCAHKSLPYKSLE